MSYNLDLGLERDLVLTLKWTLISPVWLSLCPLLLQEWSVICSLAWVQFVLWNAFHHSCIYFRVLKE